MKAGRFVVPWLISDLIPRAHSLFRKRGCITAQGFPEPDSGSSITACSRVVFRPLSEIAPVEYEMLLPDETYGCTSWKRSRPPPYDAARGNYFCSNRSYRRHDRGTCPSKTSSTVGRHERIVARNSEARPYGAAGPRLGRP